MNEASFDLSTAYTKHLRAQAKSSSAERFACPYCSVRIFSQDDHLWSHVSTEHAELLRELGVERGNDLFRKKLREAALQQAKSLAGTDPSRKHSDPPASATNSTPDINRLTLDAKKVPTRKGEHPSGSRQTRKRAGSDIHPPESPNRCPSSQDVTSRRARMGGGPEPRIASDSDHPMDSTFAVRPKAGAKQLFDPSSGQVTSTPPRTRTPQLYKEANVSATKSPSAPSPIQSSTRQPGVLEIPSDARYPGLVLQPDSRPISQEQLAAEVKSIYAGLTMVESKCIHVDKAQASAVQDPKQHPRLQADHWQALIALHRTLLHEHHDFFLASQHPSASPALRRLAAKYSMPARMWKHGIHSFLELLRHRLPESLDYMLSFIYLAYQMMALLYETVPAFEDTWIECLGDLGRYRMAIEDEDLRDRETWAGVARFWYSKAADKSPAVGRLYHHLAILARPNALQQLYYYCRSLTCVQPFMSARESILTLFDPILGKAQTSYSHSLPVDTNFIRAHGLLFEKGPLDVFDKTLPAFLNQMDNTIDRLNSKWREQGAYIAIANIAALFDYGSEDSFLRQAFNSQLHEAISEAQIQRQKTMTDDPNATILLPTGKLASPDMKLHPESPVTFSRACQLAFSTFSQILRRRNDRNVLTHFHIILAFLNQLASLPYDTSYIFDHVPFAELSDFLNTLADTEGLDARFENTAFLHKEHEDSRPLPEDYLMRGQLWAHAYYPENWFNGVHDEEERSLELASTMKSRVQRVLWLGIRLASHGRGLVYDQDRQEWRAGSASDDLEDSQDDLMELDDPTMASDSDSDADYEIIQHVSSDDDSPEMTAFRAEPFPSKPTSPYNILPQVTIMVCDATFLLEKPHTFADLIARDEWSVVIPSTAITELAEIFRNNPDSAAAAKAALDAVTEAIRARRRIRVLTAQGTDITDPALITEYICVGDADRANDDDNDDGRENSNNGAGKNADDDITIGIARQQTDLSQKMMAMERGGRSGDDGTKPAVLVSEDRRLRKRAAARGVAAVASGIVRAVLDAQRRRSGGGE